MRNVTRFAGVLLANPLDRGGITTQTGYRAAAAAACDLRSEDSAGRPCVSAKPNKQVGALRTKSACRIARVGLVHQFTKQIETSIIYGSAKQFGEGPHAKVLVDRMGCRRAHCIFPPTLHARY